LYKFLGGEVREQEIKNRGWRERKIKRLREREEGMGDKSYL
jgi:hypothetical protein